MKKNTPYYKGISLQWPNLNSQIKKGKLKSNYKNKEKISCLILKSTLLPPTTKAYLHPLKHVNGNGIGWGLFQNGFYITMNFCKAEFYISENLKIPFLKEASILSETIF